MTAAPITATCAFCLVELAPSPQTPLVGHYGAQDSGGYELVPGDSTGRPAAVARSASSPS